MKKILIIGYDRDFQRTAATIISALVGVANNPYGGLEIKTKEDVVNFWNANFKSFHNLQGIEPLRKSEESTWKLELDDFFIDEDAQREFDWLCETDNNDFEIFADFKKGHIDIY